MVKSTPINQLPNKTSIQKQTFINENHKQEFMNSQKAQSEFSNPTNSSSKVQATDDDISIQDLMSEINENKKKEALDNSKLQQQIIDLQNQIYLQKQMNESMQQPHMLNIPQAPSANLLQEKIDTIPITTKPVTTNTSTTEKSEESNEVKTNQSYFRIENLKILSWCDIKLMLICFILFTIFSSSKVKELIQNKLSNTFLQGFTTPFTSIICSILIICLFKI